jgi:DNA-binding response OmpR family regulator
MGMIDGKVVCKQIKADSTLSNTPIVLVSASNDIQQSFSEYGADDYIEKPFEIDTLISKIEFVSKQH